MIKNIWSKWGNILETIIGIIIGAGLQYLFTKFLEDKRHKRELRTQAYLDYLRCVSEPANLADSKDKALLAEIYARTADSKGRICLYGSTKVIRKFAEFERLGANMTTPERRNVYIDMVMEMRKNSGYSRRVNSKDIGLLLFGNK